MLRFIMGLATGYLTMTPNGRELSKKITDEVKKEATLFLKKEGVIEPTKVPRPTEPPQSDIKSDEQCGVDETIIE